MHGLKRVLAAALTILLLCTSSAMCQYYYYYMDGSQIPVQVFDDLVSVGLDPASGWSAAMFAPVPHSLLWERCTNVNENRKEAHEQT